MAFGLFSTLAKVDTPEERKLPLLSKTSVSSDHYKAERKSDHSPQQHDQPLAGLVGAGICHSHPNSWFLCVLRWTMCPFFLTAHLSPSICVWPLESVKMKFQRTLALSQCFGHIVVWANMNRLVWFPSLSGRDFEERIHSSLPHPLQMSSPYQKNHNRMSTHSSPCWIWAELNIYIQFKKNNKIERQRKLRGKRGSKRAVWMLGSHGENAALLVYTQGLPCCESQEGLRQKEGWTPGSKERHEHLISFDLIWC